MERLCLEQFGSLYVVVARLRCSPAVSREDRGGAELLDCTEEVCFNVSVYVCHVCARELNNVCLIKCLPLTLNHILADSSILII